MPQEIPSRSPRQGQCAEVRFQQKLTGKRNFGRLFDDQANGILLNQALLTVQRPIDPAATGYDFGFKLQGLFGSDARYARPPHEFTKMDSGDQNQFDLVEANLQFHTPWLSEGGMDWKIGRYPALEGAETIDPSTNSFYSHSYIFNFGIPMQQTGVTATWHATPLIDLYAGFDTGVNTTIDHGLLHAQNGGAPAFSGGIGFNLLDGKLTILALTHAGPENVNSFASSLSPSFDAKDKYRELNDIVTTWKVSDSFTLINELNWIHDDALNNGRSADAYGVAQYATYALNDIFTLAARGEIFADNEGVFVAQALNNSQFVAAEAGQASLVSPLTPGKSTTYGALTLGVNIKPPITLPLLSSLVIRPELRYDTTLDGKKQFNNGHDNDQVTAAIDAVITF